MYQEKENVLPIMKATAQSIATYFPVLNFALNFYEEKKSQGVQRKVLRLEEFYHSLTERIADIKEQINNDYISRDDFADVFEQTANHIMNERLKEKRRCFQNIFVNSIVTSSCSYDKTEKYIRMLESMGWTELKVLAVLYNPSKFNENKGNIIKDSNDKTYFGGIGLSGLNSTDILTQLLNESKEEISDALSYLEANRLVHQQSNAIHTQSRGNPIHILDNLLTQKGRDFAHYVIQE